MVESKPTLEEWRQLYQAAIRMKEVAPWEWMTETDIFGVQNPETGQMGFVSIMGMLGEHMALAVYLGAEGLYSFWNFQEMVESSPTVAPEMLFELPHLQASFEDRAQLSREDRAVIKQLGLKFRGAQAWPMFRSYRPGFWPWYLEAGEARFLTCVLEQAIEVALRFKEDPALLEPSDDESYLVRVPHNGRGVVWEDQIVQVPPPEPEPISIPMDIAALEAVKRLPHTRNTFEMDLFILPTPIGEKKDERPYLPYILLTTDADSGMILGHDLLKPDPDLKAMWGLIPVTVVYQFARVGRLPRQINVRSPLISELLQLLTPELGFKIKSKSVLRSLDQAKESLWEWLGGLFSAP